jgi:hypothetical protein
VSFKAGFVNLMWPHRCTENSGAISECYGHQGIARFKFDDGKLEEFKRLVRSIHGDRADQGHRNAAIRDLLHDDQSECTVLERYKDSEALIQHAANAGDLMEAILATGSVCGELLGEPSANLQAQLAGRPVRPCTHFQSM